MVLNIKNKKILVKNLHKIAKQSISLTISQFHNVSSNMINKIRKEGKKLNIKFYIVKNTLVKKALLNTHFLNIIKYISGQVILAFSLYHPGAAAKLLNLYYQNNKILKIIVASFNKLIFQSVKLNYLINMLTFKEALIKLIMLFKYITLGKFLILLHKITKNKK